jgi:hypothetical protein
LCSCYVMMHWKCYWLLSTPPPDLEEIEIVAPKSQPRFVPSRPFHTGMNCGWFWREDALGLGDP